MTIVRNDSLGQLPSASNSSQATSARKYVMFTLVRWHLVARLNAAEKAARRQGLIAKPQHLVREKLLRSIEK
jgi:hypothetical protein